MTELLMGETEIVASADVGPRRFYLIDGDHVREGIEFSNGGVALEGLSMFVRSTTPPKPEAYESLEWLLRVHEAIRSNPQVRWID